MPKDPLPDLCFNKIKSVTTHRKTGTTVGSDYAEPQVEPPTELVAPPGELAEPPADPL